MNKETLIRKFDKQAAMYDNKRRRLELGAYRRRLLHVAEGRVLELGVGAGANFPFYAPDVELTAVDFSPAMLAAAKTANDRQFGLNVRFIQGDAETLTLPDHAFDTVVSTLTLCAYRDPAGMLRKLNRWCKPGGRVLLMEHGLGRNKAVAFVQKAVDPLAHRIAGCHLDRDILGLVRDSPLVVEKAERHMAFGVLHLFWCRAAAG